MAILGVSVVNTNKYINIGLPNFLLLFSARKFLKYLNVVKLNKTKLHYPNIKSSKRQILFNSIGFILFALFIAYLVVYQLPEDPSTNIFQGLVRSFVNYYNNHRSILLTYLILGVIINAFIAVRATQNRTKKYAHLALALLVKTPLQAIFAAPLAIIAVFICTLLFSNVQLLLSDIIPTQLHIQTDKNKIRQLIDSSDGNIKLIGIKGSASKTYIANSKIFGAKSNFYRKNFVPAIPNTLFITTKNLSKSVVMTGNELYIREMDKEMIQAITPTLAKKLIKKSLYPRFIKDEPNVEIISRQDYLKYREKQINDQIEEITGYIKELNKSLGTLSYNIKTAKNNISTLQNNIQLNTQYRDEEYNSCINDTYTYYGLYYNYTYRTYTDEYCQTLRNRRDQQNAEYQTEIVNQQNNLSYYQSQYGELKQYIDQFQDYKQFIEATKQLTPYELGLFEPESAIKVVLDSISDKDISNFMVTLIHEYMHYTSYVSEDRTLPQFFEEGLTEHFARKIMSSQLDRGTDLGYPLISKIILAMVKKIPVSKFEEIYFTKNTDQLQNILDETYGKDFYNDSKLYFALIPLSPMEEALKFANNIMFKIDGSELTTKDALSTY